MDGGNGGKDSLSVGGEVLLEGQGEGLFEGGEKGEGILGGMGGVLSEGGGTGLLGDGGDDFCD